MDTGPVVTTPSVGARNSIILLIPICCIGLLFFLIAATIVISLIPIYLGNRGSAFNPNNNINKNNTNNPNTTIGSIPLIVLYRINNGTLLVGALNVNNCAVIQQDQRNLAASNNNVAPSVPTIVQCTVTGNITRRRRRQSQAPVGNLIVLNELLSGTDDCPQGDCLTARAQSFRVLLLTRGTFTLIFTADDGTQVLFSVTIISADIIITATPTSPQNPTAAVNDIIVLNYALTLEQLEANFYTTYQAKFTAQDFINAGFTQQTYDYFNVIYANELAHVGALTEIITQLNGTAVPKCVYNFGVVTDVKSYITTARALENTGTMAYDGVTNGIADPTLRQIVSSVATVEARHASYLNSLANLTSSSTLFENATAPSTVIAGIQPFIISCPYTITAPTVPYVGSSSFNGTIPLTNNTVVTPYTNAMYVNDLKALNYMLIIERLKAGVYNGYVSQFSSSDYINNGYSDATSLFFTLKEFTNAYVQLWETMIFERGATPLPPCTYDFPITNVQSFVPYAYGTQNGAVGGYNGVVGLISDPNLILTVMTVVTVEARLAGALNKLFGVIPFPSATDLASSPTVIPYVLNQEETCPFTFDPPVILARVPPLSSQSFLAKINDIAILNYILSFEHLEADFYTTYQANFTAQDFINAGFTQQTYDYFNIIYVHELAHVRTLTAIVTQLNGTAVPPCIYKHPPITDVRSYITAARTLENTGTMAYTGVVNAIFDPILRQTAMTIATVEARHSSYLNSLANLSPFPTPFENATIPSVVIASFVSYIVACEYAILAPSVPYVGLPIFNGTIPVVNDTSSITYTNAMYLNDMKVLNYALVSEHLESNFYNTYVSQFSSSDFISNGFPDATSFYIMIREIEKAHVQFLEMTITQRGGTPVTACKYNFTISDIQDFVSFSSILENTVVKAYDGAIARLTDPNLIVSVAAIATVEARFASYLNGLNSSVPFPDVTDPILTPNQVVAILASYQICTFSPDLPIILNPSSYVLNT